MKKSIFLLIVFFLLFSFIACSWNNSQVKIKKVDSNLYSQEEIRSAINTVIEEMDKNWEGCTLKEIYFVGDKNLKVYRDLESYPTNDLIALMSSFEVDESGRGGLLEPNSTYTCTWILKKDSKGHWKLVDYGI